MEQVGPCESVDGESNEGFLDPSGGDVLHRPCTGSEVRLPYLFDRTFNELCTLLLVRGIHVAKGIIRLPPLVIKRDEPRHRTWIRTGEGMPRECVPGQWLSLRPSGKCEARCFAVCRWWKEREEGYHACRVGGGGGVRVGGDGHGASL